jgi:hypothetical protein
MPVTAAVNSNGGNTHNSGTEEWKALAERRSQPIPQRSRASMRFEEQLRQLLANSDATDIEGCWIDWVVRTREPVWVSNPNCDADDTDDAA